MDDELLERVDDAIEDALLAHESLDNDSRCSCGVINNMDGDVLHCHRLGEISWAVRGVFAELLGREQRTCDDGAGGVSTNWKTGETTSHFKPCTRQSRWVTKWVTDDTPALDINLLHW